MPTSPPAAIDPVFAEVAKAIYGDVDPREIAKFSPGGADLHADGPMTPEQAKKQKKLALVGLGATGLATVGAGHAISASVLEHRHRIAEARGEPPPVPKVKNGLHRQAARAVARKLKLSPVKTAGIIGAGVLGLHGVELASDVLGAHAQTKQLREANKQLGPKKPVAKAFRLRPLNSLPDQVPSLRAKRPRTTPLPANPRTKRGVFQPVSKVGDVTWTGLFSKVDTDKRQVFGWASVSQINGEDVVDLQGDIVPIEEIEKSAYKYVLDSRKGGDMHRRVSKLDDGTVPHHTADMIESFVVTPEKLEKMGLPPNALPLGWWVGYHVNDDEQWSLVKSGARAGFSIHGSGTRTTVSKMGPEVKDWDVYHALRRKGKTKTSAAKIANSVSKSIREDLDDGRKRRPLRLKERTRQAVHPPPVKLKPVTSSAIDSMGYQRQTRRLSVQMHSNLGRPYQYRVDPKEASAALNAPSLGHHYATQVRGKAQRATRYTLADRARLFAKPDVSKGLFKVKQAIDSVKAAPAELMKPLATMAPVKPGLKPIGKVPLG
jgi:hypothetical protein